MQNKETDYLPSTRANRIELVCKDCSDSLEDCTCIKDTIDLPKQEDEFCYYSGLPSPIAYSKEEIKLEEVFNDEKRENIKKFIDEINNPSQPKDKAEELVNQYRMILMNENTECGNEILCTSIAKQCALIAVDGLIYETQFEVPNIRQRYWLEVKKEIEKL